MCALGAMTQASETAGIGAILANGCGRSGGWLWCAAGSTVESPSSLLRFAGWGV